MNGRTISWTVLSALGCLVSLFALATFGLPALYFLLAWAGVIGG